MIYAHDTCRVISSLIKYGNDRHREGIFQEIKDNLVEMAKSKYARFVVKKMLKNGSKEQVAEIVKAFIGKCTKLIKHSVRFNFFFNLNLLKLIKNNFKSMPVK